jgi:hypothetical protein
MRIRVLVISLAACIGLAALAALAFGWSFQEAVLLAPVIVVSAGAGAFIVVLWTRIVIDSIRGRGRDA